MNKDSMTNEIDERMVANNLEPAYLTHPGEVIKDEIEARGISQRKLARNRYILLSTERSAQRQAAGKH